jgi:hypothetical protein
MRRYGRAPLIEASLMNRIIAQPGIIASGTKLLVQSCQNLYLSGSGMVHTERAVTAGASSPANPNSKKHHYAVRIIVLPGARAIARPLFLCSKCRHP